MRKLHWYYKFLIFFIIFFSMFFFLNRNISNLVNNSNYKDYMNAIIMPLKTISVTNLSNYGKLLKENQQLKEELLIKKTEANNEKNLQDEIENLKKTMSLKTVYTGYKTTYAKTITRNKMYWYSTITIDKGSKDGIQKNQAVVGLNGLIGIVKDTTKKSSTIKLITNNDSNSKISGMIKIGKETKIGLIENYEYPYLKVSMIDSKGIKVGDKFYSLGLDNFPKNIYIGTVKKIERDNFDLSYILYVEPKQDMNDINYVVVLGNK